MKHTMRLTGSLILMMFIVFSVNAADSQRGKLLYTNSCTKCHSSQAHIRDSRKAQNIGEIQAQVQRWVQNNNLKWTQEDINDVAHYLNVQYYKYSK